MAVFMVSYQTNKGNGCSRQEAGGKKEACKLVKQRIPTSFAHHAKKLEA